MGVLVAADLQSGLAVEAVEAPAEQHPVHRRGRLADVAAMRSGPQRRLRRRYAMWAPQAAEAPRAAKRLGIWSVRI